MLYSLPFFIGFVWLSIFLVLFVCCFSFPESALSRVNNISDNDLFYLLSLSLSHFLFHSLPLDFPTSSSSAVTGDACCHLQTFFSIDSPYLRVSLNHTRSCSNI